METLNKYDDYIGKSVGYSSAIRIKPKDEAKKLSKRNAIAEMQCVCGNYFEISLPSLDRSIKNGSSTSCGCMNGASKRIDLVGQRYGMLTVVEMINVKGKKTSVRCICDCGNEYICSLDAFRFKMKENENNVIYSCGCYKERAWRRVDYSGKTFGYLTVEYMIYPGDTEHPGNNDYTYAKCKCKCNNEVIFMIGNLLRDGLHSCGCAKKEIARRQAIDITGQKFGRLLVTEMLWDYTPLKVRCICECGNEHICNKANLVSGKTKSCGCLPEELPHPTYTKDFTGLVSDYGVKILSRSRQDETSKWLWNCECPVCHTLFEAYPSKVLNGHVTSCGCTRMSSSERLIFEFLAQQNIIFQSQFSFDDCIDKNALRYDFAILDDNGCVKHLIEYDGIQHFEPVEYFGGYNQFVVQQKRDQIKNQYCEENNIPITRLPYTLSCDEIKRELINIISTLTTAVA